MPSLSLIVGMELIHTVRLEMQNIFTTEELLDRAATKKSRNILADKIWASENEILCWACQSDLYRIPSLGRQHMKILKLCGVNTSLRLSLCESSQLIKIMDDMCKQKKIEMINPTKEKAQYWISQAKILKKVPLEC